MSTTFSSKKILRERRHRRIRSRIDGTATCPRLSVFRSSAHIYLQAIDDVTQRTLASVSDLDIKGKKTKQERAVLAGEAMGKQLTALGIEQVVFDRGGFRYHGRVRALADAVRKSGLKF